MPRVQLTKLIARIVDKWSLDYISRAKLGETEAMVQMAEIMFSKHGWGQIYYNPQQGRRWLEVAASKGDPFALHALHNLGRLLKERHQEAIKTNRYQINSLENPKLGFDVEKRMSNLTGGTHSVTPEAHEPFLKKTVAARAQRGNSKPNQDV